MMAPTTRPPSFEPRLWLRHMPLMSTLKVMHGLLMSLAGVSDKNMFMYMAGILNVTLPLSTAGTLV